MPAPDYARPLRSAILADRDKRIRRCAKCGGWRTTLYRGGEAPHACVDDDREARLDRPR